MAKRDEIVEFANEYLGVYGYKDYGPQGMQYTGVRDVKKIATAVSSTSDVIHKARTRGADMLICHHGLFWNTESKVIDLTHRLRMSELEHSLMSLLAYHLCLDAHPEVGNNIIIAKALGVEDPEPFAGIGWGGTITQDSHIHLMTKLYRILPQLAGKLEYFNFASLPIKKVAVVTGRGGSLINDAIKEGYDAFVTGEAEEPSKALAKENKISFIAAGHYMTETVGVKALGEKLAREFQIPHEFITDNNPV